MALAMLTGRTPGLFDDTLGLRPIPDTSIVLADVTAAHIAYAWLPEHVDDHTSRQTITPLTTALDADLTWHESAGS
ncbi:hypothetical protein [Amycolatopsis sp. WQ 127309]|uniref:hypothetical protein n=1 Tax=Amycolatopsis sp. WQ 127309 TaxID=2932773 RepID=UPI001FF42450|nr:hypothetical protein [Amycolatopsis sp. WQ 127309]UOZ05570.1 hypothetical protein MUY22_43205 [Amycolatopsis sp. WQ 127309]